jgi:hypothetical protein
MPTRNQNLLSSLEKLRKIQSNKATPIHFAGVSVSKSKHLFVAWKLSLLVLSGIFILLTAYSTLYWKRATGALNAGTLAMTSGRLDQNFHLPILAMEPNSPFLQMGAKPGDTFVFDHPGDRQRLLGTDETIGVTLYGTLLARHLSLRPVAVPQSAEDTTRFINYLINGVQNAICLFLGVLVGIRGAGNKAMRALALVLTLSTVPWLLVALPGGALHDFVADAGMPVAICLVYSLFLYFSLQFPTQNPYLNRRLVRVLFRAFIVIFSTVIALFIAHNYGVLPWSVRQLIPLKTWQILLIQVAVIASLDALWCAWRSSSGAERQRLAWVGICMGTIFATYSIYSFSSLFGVVLDRNIWSNLLDCIQLTAYTALGYAMLRYRLFDVGFAINRTLVFSITSMLLILVFFLIERAAHHFLHFEDAEKNALFNGSVAFGLFFTFNRLHHRVDHLIEKLLFREWHKNAEALRHFVGKAGHFTSSDDLLVALGHELDRFTGQAGYALYRAGADGQFTCVHSTLTSAPVSINENDDVAVTLRATRAQTELRATHWVFPGEIAMPMMQGVKLNGMAIIGKKLTGDLYRPDEIEALAFAVTQVGLDLFALRVVQLEEENREMARRARANEDKLGYALREVDAMRLLVVRTSPL